MGRILRLMGGVGVLIALLLARRLRRAYLDCHTSRRCRGLSPAPCAELAPPRPGLADYGNARRVWYGNTPVLLADYRGDGARP